MTNTLVTTNSRAMDCICGHTDTYIPVDIVSNVTL